jgi:c-di-GMP-binding flagellar brake protein YcgR
MSDKRRHIRTAVHLKVNITHPSFGTVSAVTRDISNGGTFVVLENRYRPPVDSVVEVQVLDSPQGAPVLRMRVVRHEEEGIGLEFMDIGAQL